MRSKNSWVLLLMVLSGIVLGGFIGEAASGAAVFILAEFWPVLWAE